MVFRVSDKTCFNSSLVSKSIFEVDLYAVLASSESSESSNSFLELILKSVLPVFLPAKNLSTASSLSSPLPIGI